MIGQEKTECAPDLSTALYIHIPFCRTKCAYCDFNSSASKDFPEERYIDSIIREFDYYLEKGFFDSALKSVYLGGGTPSILSTCSIARIMEHIRGAFSSLEGAEVTIEAIPKGLGTAKLEGYLLSGINRLSLGIQSCLDSDLNVLGRGHHEKEAPVSAPPQLRRFRLRLEPRHPPAAGPRAWPTNAGRCPRTGGPAAPSRPRSSNHRR